MNKQELINSKKEFANAQALLKDLLHGDPYALKRLEGMDLNMEAIKLALEVLNSNDNITEKDRLNLMSESWRINFRDRPPTPEEFLTEKYLGPTAKTIYPRIRETFLAFMDPTQRARNLILYPMIGWGKLSQYEEKIMTPAGYKKARDIQIGDKVLTPQGKEANVINVQDYPKEEIYKVTFTDGRSALVGGPHYWKAARTYTHKYWDKESKSFRKYPKGGSKPNWKIITTEKLLEDLNSHSGENRGWFIPLCEKANHIEKKHLIPPYILGALLGDGSLHKDISIGNDDKEILEKIIKESKDKPWEITYRDYTEKENSKSSVNYKINFINASAFKEELKRLGLENTYSDDKFIPEEYKYDSFENRIQLLQGLMDTDGTVLNKKRSPRASYYTNSPRLRDDVIELCSGLGASRCTQYKSKKGTYRVDIIFPDNSFPIFHLARKQNYIDEEYSKDKTLCRKKFKPRVLHIKSIEKTDLIGGKCIEIDDEERLYLTNNYIVTHNSFLSALIILYISVCVSLMRNPYKYFGLSPATLLAQVLISYSIKKSRELLLAPFLNIMGSSPYFEKVNRKDTMKELKGEFENKAYIDRLYYTTADPDSELMFDSGVAIKVASSVQSLLGLSIIASALSELAYFRDAGKALALDEMIITDKGNKCMGDIQVGDNILSPDGSFTPVISIPWQGKDDLYEIEMDDGRTVKCNANHKWKVFYWDSENIYHNEIVTTQFMIDHPKIEFEILSI